MDYKARITHLYKDGEAYKLCQADIYVRSSDVDLSNGEPPFYYQVGDAPSTPSISCNNNLVTITSSGSDSIYYTTDGTEPDTTKTKYSGAFAIASTVTVKAISYNGEIASAVASKSCTYIAPPSAPSISVSDNNVTLTCETADKVYYTIDGTDPDNTKTLYSAPFAISQTVTVKAVGYKGTIKGTVASQECAYVAPDTEEVI